MSVYIPIIEVELSDPFGIQICRNAGIEIRFKDPGDPRTIILSTLDWLCGSNSWGYHNSHVFAQPASKVKQSMRIMDAAERARDEGRTHVPMPEGDYDELKKSVEQPQPHPNTFPIPVAVARAILPINDAITKAKTDVPEDWGRTADDAPKSAKNAAEK